jgi:hypothetical protein
VLRTAGSWALCTITCASSSVTSASATAAGLRPGNMTDAVEKGICKNLKATLIQDWKSMHNLDSKIHLLGFVCFKFQFHISFAETFSTASVINS